VSTSLQNAEILLSKEMNDYFSSTTTSAGDSTGLNLKDTALADKDDEWAIGYDQIVLGTGVAPDEEERRIKGLISNDGTLGLKRAHTTQVASSSAYRIHRLFSASEKRLALIHAAKAGYPHIFQEVRDESRVSGNWAKDGALNVWTSSTVLTYWTASGVTSTKTTTLPYYKHGTKSAKLDTAAGYIYQDITLNADLQKLAGKTVTFSAQGWCDTASCLRLGILYDGTNLTYSSYHDGDSAWTEDSDPLEIEYKIDDNPTNISFRVYHAVAAGTSYVNDLRIIGPDGARIYIGDLGLVKNEAHQVFLERSNYSNAEPWYLIHGVTYDRTNGYMHIPDWVSKDFRLRIKGVKYLNFYDTSGDVGTDWADTIALDSPQTEILVAEAAVYLCRQMTTPDDSESETTKWGNSLADWMRELNERRQKYGMEMPEVTVNWGIG
jgi:hypothetical protein